MRDGYSSLLPAVKRARVMAGVWLLALAGGVFGLDGAAAPSITSISPDSGTNYTRITITGTGFGSSQGTSTVTFGGTEASRVYEWSDTEIEARPTTSLAVGAHAVVVTVGGMASNGVDYTLLPQLTAFCLAPSQTLAEPSGSFQMGVHRSGPTTAALTVTVTYSGTATHGTDYTAPATLTIAAGDRRKEARLTVLDDSVAEGNERIIYFVSAEGYISNNCQVTLEDDDTGSATAPTITSLNPDSGAVGTVVTITGTAFGATQGTSTVTFNGTTASATTWSATSITAAVPAGAATGNVLVTVGGQASNGMAFTVTATPAISGLDPTSGEEGTSVVITGTNFGATKRTSTVTFNGTWAATTSWSATSITAAVPSGATTGSVVVTVGGVGSNGVAFTVTGVRVAPRELTIEEGGTGTYTVVLDSKPASAVTVSMFAPAGTDLSVDILPVFTASNWDRPQTVTVTAGEDEDKEDDIDTIAHRTASADAGYHDLTVDGVEVTVTDNDAGAGVTVEPTGLTIEEGEEGTYTVVLNTEPAAGVTVAVTAGGDLTVMPGSLDFTTLDWDTAQEVTVTVGQDEDAEDETESITHAVTSTDTGYSGLAVDGVRVTIADDEGTGGPGGTEELTVSTTRLRITEGNMGKYTVVLNREPASGVTVGVSAPSGGDLTVMPATLDFTTLNWDTPQEVRVTAGEDTDLEDEVESITHTITRASSSSSSSLRGALGRQAAFAMAMGSPAPTREYVYLGGRLVAIAQGGAVSEASVVVTIDDDDDPDTPGVPALTNSLRLTEGHTGAYTLELGAAPIAPVTIALSVSRGSDNVADVTVRPTPLTFTTTDWADPQWVTVTVAEDSDTVGETETISHRATSTDSRYQGIEIASVRVVIRDRNPTRTPTGTLGANPDPCTIAAGQTTCSTTLTWTSENTTAVQVRRIMGQTNEIVVRRGSPSGQTVFDRIDLTDSTFYLYDYSDGGRGRQLATVTVHGVRPLSIDPTSGEVGTVVTITGSHFGASRGTGANASTVTFNGTAVVSYTVWSDTRIVVVVPAGATSGDVVVTVDGAERTAGSFRVGSEPACTISAAPNPCTIAAGQTTCTSTLTWTTENTTAVRVWTQQQELSPFGYVGGLLTAFTDTDSTSGNKQATIKQAPRIRHKFAVHDHSGGSRGDELCSVIATGDRALSLSPTSGPVGTVVTITGSGFDTTQGTVSFGGISASITVWSDTRIVFDVPQNATTGTHTVKVTVGGVERTAGTFAVTTMDVPTIGSFTADPANIKTNGSSTLEWETSNADHVVLYPGNIDVTTDADRRYSVGPITVGASSSKKAVTYTLTACAEDCSTDPPSKKVSKSVTVTAWAQPTIGSCSANPTNVKTGGTSELSWTATNAQTVTVTGSSAAITSPHTVRMNTKGSHTFTLTASNPAWTGTDAASCSIRVTAWDRPTASIRADRTTINEGQPFTLSWSSSNAASASINQGIGPVTPNVSGGRELRPTEGTYPYTITASNPTQPPYPNATASVEVTVRPRPTGEIWGDPNPCTIPSGRNSCTSTIKWRAQGTTGTLVHVSHLTRAFASSGATGSQDASWIQEAPAHTYTFYLYDYMDRVQGAELARVTVTGQRPTGKPTIGSFTASSTNIKPNGSSTLRWQTSNAEEVTLNDSSVAVDGSQVVRPSTTGEHQYTLMACASNCSTDTGMDKVTEEVTVTVWAQPTIGSCSASSANVKTNRSSTLSWTVSNAQTVTVNGTSVAVNGPHTVTPTTAGTHTYTVKASNPGWTESNNDAASCSITVKAWDRPTASISANRTTINEGQPFTLSWSSSNAASASINQGIGPVTPNVSGGRELRPTEGTYPYTITASNPTQPPYPNATASVEVTVRPRPTGEIWGDPNPCTIPSGRNSCTSTIKWRAQGTTGTLVHVSHLTRAFASSGATGSQDASWIQEAPAHTYTFYLYDYMDRVQGAELARVTVTGQRPPPPMISVLNPTSGSVGDAVRLTGTSFGGSQGTSTVTFNGVSATATSWSDRTIDVRVPTGATSGSVVVTVGGQASNGVAFTVTVPARPWINDLSPPDGVVGTAVTISGVNFGNTGSVTFNATYGSPSSWSDTSISVEVPSGATSGPVVVTANGQDSNSVHFLVTQLQRDDEEECEDPEDCPEDEEEESPAP